MASGDSAAPATAKKPHQPKGPPPRHILKAHMDKAAEEAAVLAQTKRQQRQDAEQTVSPAAAKSEPAQQVTPVTKAVQDIADRAAQSREAVQAHCRKQLKEVVQDITDRTAQAREAPSEQPATSAAPSDAGAAADEPQKAEKDAAVVAAAIIARKRAAKEAAANKTCSNGHDLTNMKEVGLKVGEDLTALQALPIKDLKAWLESRGIKYDDCLEKTDLLRRAQEHLQKAKGHSKFTDLPTIAPQLTPVQGIVHQAETIPQKATGSNATVPPDDPTERYIWNYGLSPGTAEAFKKLPKPAIEWIMSQTPLEAKPHNVLELMEKAKKVDWSMWSQPGSTPPVAAHQTMHGVQWWPMMNHMTPAFYPWGYIGPKEKKHKKGGKKHKDKKSRRSKQKKKSAKAQRAESASSSDSYSSNSSEECASTKAKKAETKLSQDSKVSKVHQAQAAKLASLLSALPGNSQLSSEPTSRGSRSRESLAHVAQRGDSGEKRLTEAHGDKSRFRRSPEAPPKRRRSRDTRRDMSPEGRRKRSKSRHQGVSNSRRSKSRTPQRSDKLRPKAHASDCGSSQVGIAPISKAGLLTPPECGTQLGMASTPKVASNCGTALVGKLAPIPKAGLLAQPEKTNNEVASTTTLAVADVSAESKPPPEEVQKAQPNEQLATLQPKQATATEVVAKDAEAEAATTSSMAADLKDWLKKLDNGKGALLQYFDVLCKEFDADFAQLSAARLGEPRGPGVLDSIDPSFWEACGIKPMGHRLLLAKGILELPS